MSLFGRLPAKYGLRTKERLKTSNCSRYGKCSKISNTFSLSVLILNAGYQGWNSQNTPQNSKQLVETLITLLQTESAQMFSNVSWEDLYADDLIIIADAESMEECVHRLLAWKEGIERKGLRVNAGNTKIMIDGTGLDRLQSSGKFPCAICRTGVGSNSIKCYLCNTGCTRSAVELKHVKEDLNYKI